MNGDVSYASQEPWLFAASVRQNILFGLPMDKVRYKEVVRRCALEKDFASLEFGDQTIVGERGVSLSGGQRARISLARACYRPAAIYLLDDPLSAVDAHVGRHLFDQCMRTLLRGKTIILVTHQLQYLQNADHIIIMDRGEMVGSGSYESLKSSGLDFAKMLTKNAESDEESSDGESTDMDTNSQRSSGRRRSRTSVTSKKSEKRDAPPPKQMEEGRQVGSIASGVYRKYISAMGGICAFFWVAVFFLATQGAASGGDYFLTYWTNKEDSRGILEPDVTTPDVVDSRYVDIYIFTALTIGTIIITLARSFFFFTVSCPSLINTLLKYQ